MAAADPRRAYDGLPVMIWTVGTDRRCDYLNPHRLEFTGRSAADELGWGWTERVHSGDRDNMLAAYHEAFESRQAFTLEYRLQRADGEYRRLLDSFVPRRDQDGEFAGYVGCGVDVTERRAMEHRLKRLERTDALAQLAGGVAHDFNDLLTGILGHVSLLLEDRALSAEARDDLAQIQRAADRAAGLTRQLLAFNRRQSLVPQVLDLNRVVSGTVSALRGLAGSRVEVVPALAPELDSVMADPGQLELLLLQLGANAREAMPDGGRLELRTSAAKVDAATAARRPGLAAGAYVTLVVRDTGGQPVVLPPGEGAGPGLTSVYGIVKQSGGYITADSDPGRGTTFTIYLRRAEGSAAPAGEQGGGELGGSGTILLVEDEEQVRDLGRRVLERAGYTVITAPDAESAGAVADRHPGHINLLITDLVLPGMGGRELAARLAIHRPAIKVLYVSGTSDDAIARHRLLEPGTEFLEKPFSLPGLLRKVRQVLGAQPEPRPA